VTQPKAIICLTGSELTRGETRDANGSFLATELTMLGIHVEELRLLPDNERRLEEAFSELCKRAELVIISGGLGPTADDLTIGTLARALGRGVIRDETARENMRQKALKRVASEAEIPGNFYKQAEVVEGALVLQNPVGLAPASVVKTQRGLVAAVRVVPGSEKISGPQGELPEDLVADLSQETLLHLLHFQRQLDCRRGSHDDRGSRDLRPQEVPGGG